MHVTPEILQKTFCALSIHSGTIYLHLQTQKNTFVLYTIRPESNVILNVNEPDGAFALTIYELSEFLNKLLIKNKGKRVRLYTFDEFIEYFGVWMPF